MNKHDQAAQALKAALDGGKVAAKDQAFARDLLKAFDRYNGCFTEKQLHWAIKLSTPRPAPESVGNLKLLNELFAFAGGHMKSPKVRLVVGGERKKVNGRLTLKGGTHVVVKQASGNTRYPGQVIVASPGGFGGPYYGRITQQGDFVVGRDFLDGLITELKLLAEQPAKVAAEYGQMTANCCFCGKFLDDDRSTAVGYGPVCAKHYGLPWGEESTVDQLTDLEAAQQKGETDEQAFQRTSGFDEVEVEYDHITAGEWATGTQ